VVIEPGQTASLDIGPPLRNTVQVTRERNILRLTYQLLGQASSPASFNFALDSVPASYDIVATATSFAYGGPGGWEGHGLKPLPTTQFPQSVGLGETWDPALLQQAAAIEAYEARYIFQSETLYSTGRRGEHWRREGIVIRAPNADLARDPRWGRSEEVYGEDPFFNGTMAVAFIKGLQGDDPKYWQAAALLKHFLANSYEDHRNSSSSDFDQRLFWEYYSVPFRMGFTEGGAKAVMASYNAWNGTPMAVNPILKSIVREQWGVDVISSDGGAVKLLVDPRKLFPTQKEAVVACLKAGINQFLDRYLDETKAALKDGSITEAEIDALLRPKFRVTIRLGLLDPPEMVPYAKIKDSPGPWNTEKGRAVSKEMALESVVLLKNAGGLLPIDRNAVKSVAVIGPRANDVALDWYSGTPTYTITPLDGIKAAAGAVKVNEAASNDDDAAVNAAKQSDVAIVFVGSHPTCGAGWAKCPTPSDGKEAMDRKWIDLEQEALVKRVYAANPKTVVVLVSSFPIAIKIPIVGIIIN